MSDTKWHTIPDTTFPDNVQKLITKALEAAKVASTAKKAMSEAIRPFGPRLVIDGNPILQDGEELAVNLYFGKVSVASVPPRGTSGKAKVSLASL